ncbi:MAG: hypothetical protein HC810_03990 [Acaryochloridaceae cyanobacterium RL_2_7]|nr:hypothetical protein [Acaryochloridaceae cyanobacterium RL_2_7]
MSNAERVSPMTLYYLRRLIRAKRTELTSNSSMVDIENHLDLFLSQSNDAGLEREISVRVLEQLVTLHQSLVVHASSDKAQIADIESQIYDMLSLQWKPSQGLSTDLGHLNQFSPQKCREIIKTLYNMKQKYESLVSPKIVQNYLLKSCPSMDLTKIDSSQSIAVKPPLNEDTISSRLSIYEQWIHAFIQTLETVLAHHETAEAVAENQPMESIPEEVPALSWSAVCEAATQLAMATRESTPKRCRDLLKQMNHLLETSQGFMNPELAVQYFVATRPNQEWCHMFQLSPDDKVVFKGNSWAIVTHSYFSLYVQWMNAFIQKCSIYAPFDPDSYRREN